VRDDPLDFLDGDGVDVSLFRVAVTFRQARASGADTAGRHLDNAAQSVSLAILEHLVHYKRFDALEAPWRTS
jgi:hypothetical protein